MRCSPAAVSNAAPPEFTALLQAADHRCPVTDAIARAWLLETLRRLVRSQGALAGAYVHVCPRGDDVAELQIEDARPIRLGWSWSSSQTRVLPEALRIAMRVVGANGAPHERHCALAAPELRDRLLELVTETKSEPQFGTT